MADSDAQIRAAAARNALRDSAKWIVGGVVATSATVFTGSSLTHFGSLDFENTVIRMTIAVAGLSLGFVGLGIILVPAVRLLAIDLITFRLLATEPKLDDLRSKMENRYTSRPDNNATIAQLSDTYDQTEDVELESEIKAFADVVVADASFQLVRGKFDKLVKWLMLGGPLALAGFGAFAWAANPAEPKSPAQSCPPAVVTVNVAAASHVAPAGSPCAHCSASDCCCCHDRQPPLKTEPPTPTPDS